MIRNCTDFQTMSGAPLLAGIMTRPGTFVLLSGEPTVYRKTADNGALRPQGFCPPCGTAIYLTSDTDDPKAYAVRLGALRQCNELVPRGQGFVRSQQAWVNDRVARIIVGGRIATRALQDPLSVVRRRFLQKSPQHSCDLHHHRISDGANIVPRQYEATGPSWP
jgi:hypothetical protein